MNYTLCYYCLVFPGSDLSSCPQIKLFALPYRSISQVVYSTGFLSVWSMFVKQSSSIGISKPDLGKTMPKEQLFS